MRSMKCGRYRRRIIAEIFVFLIYIEIIDGQGFMFNNQLAVIANDCYTRVAIGSRLSDANTTTVQVATVSDCEDACSNNRTTCKSISFGIGVRGNASCILGNQIPNSDTLQTDEDYDVYIRTQKTPHCEADRLFSLSGGRKMQMSNNMTTVMPTISFMNNPLPMQPGVVFQSTRPNGDRSTGSTINQRWFPTNDDDFRSYDIERNKNIHKDSHDKSSTHDSNYNNYNRFDKNGGVDEKAPEFFDKIDYGSFFGHKIRTIESTKSDSGDSGFGSFSIGKNLFPVDYSEYSKPIVQQSYLTISGKSETGGSKGFDSRKPVYTEVPFVTKSLDKPPTGSFGFVIEHGSDKVGYSGINFGGSGHRTDVGVRPISIFEFHGIDKAKSRIEDSDDNGSRFKMNSHSDHGIYRYSTPVVHRREPENHRFRQTGQLPDTSVFKYSPERSYPHYVTGGNDGGHGIGSTKACYRKIPGKKVAEVHIRRTIECERMEDCRQDCELQKNFPCEGFSYRRMGTSPRGICELASMPFSRMDLSKDFMSDSHYEYHGRDAACYRKNYGETYNNQRPWRYPTPKPNLPYGPPRDSWRSRQPDRAFSPPRFGDRIPDNFYSKPPDYDRRPGYETPRDGSRYSGRPYVVPRGPDDSSHGGGGRRGPDRSDYRTFGYGRPYPPRPIDDPPNRPMEIDVYSRYPPKPPHYLQFPERRDDHGYPDSVTDTNEVGPYIAGDRKNDWGSYSNTYGSSYGYDTNQISKLEPPKNDHDPHKSPRPFGNDHVYGQFYNYGGAFGYGDNYIPTNRDVLYGGTENEHECSIRTGAGFKVGRNLIGSTYLAQNVDECEKLCHQEKTLLCRTYSYRYNVEATDPTNNCLLSAIPYENLSFYMDIEPDRNYDIYAMGKDTSRCITSKQPDQRPPDDCFWRVKSGFGMPTDVIKKGTSVTGLGECESECVRSQEFTCRSFVFRHGQDSSGDSLNCFLSDWSSQEINPENLIDADGAELYERGSFGRGCEPFPFTRRPNVAPTNRKFPEGGEVCYSSYQKPCRLSPYSVVLSIRVETETDCRQRCSKMRSKDDVPCWSFSYKIKGDGSDNNCLLSDVPSRDLRPGLDYIYDDDHILFVWQELEPQCLLIDDTSDIVGPASVPGRPIPYPDVERPNYGRPGSGLPPQEYERPGYGSLPSSYDRPSYGPPNQIKPIYGPPSLDHRRPGYGPPRPDRPNYEYLPSDHGRPYSENERLPGYAKPPPQSERPRPGYERPPPEYGIPPPGYGRPPSEYDRPLPGVGRPTSEYDTPQASHGRPPPIQKRPPLPDNDRPLDGNLIPDDSQEVIPLNPNSAHPDRPPYHDRKEGHGAYGGGFSDDKFNHGVGFHGYDNKLGAVYHGLTVFQHYSVSGYPCKRGTKCERNKIAGFWSCETEGSEFGSWDYCCEPTSHCGFSKGFNYPWCYVGPVEEQWRPCSEKYFPYLPSPRPIIRSQKDNRKTNENARHLDDDTELDKNFVSRRWPVAYLHCEPPPNERDSIAATNIQKDHPSNNVTRTRKRVEKSTDQPGKLLRLSEISQEIPVKSKNESLDSSGHVNSKLLVTELRFGKVERIPKPARNRRRSKNVTTENLTYRNDTRTS
ncbi:uncharacterized protein LOC117168318 isoform X2 [Belonocnema kinseyi]|uniref:uncharacterized protein LOC117168318 isoform X2 n=1 Tax=Belonocnema kinseyi TaxID=2817044 RepID=UPI00143D88F0|nr:uncharacterized protein LOC117168318 isoform X2 [Belonocnema kinseyi]